MANSLTTSPIYVDTDMTVSYRKDATVIALTADPTGVQVTNILITVPTGNSAAAGTIIVTDGATTPVTLLTIPVTTTTAYPIRLEYTFPLTWRDFEITGVAATHTAMQIWTR